MDGRFGAETRDALIRLGHNVSIAFPRYDSAPFSEPNGISLDDGEYKSAVYPVAKPTVALGLDESDRGGLADVDSGESELPEATAMNNSKRWSVVRWLSSQYFVMGIPLTNSIAK